MSKLATAILGYVVLHGIIMAKLGFTTSMFLTGYFFNNSNLARFTFPKLMELDINTEHGQINDE
jgi:hypothetical protein